MNTPIKVGVSSCLCGNPVRHDGSAKKNAYLLDTLGRYFELTPYCPEAGAGLGVPRPTLRLKRFEYEVRLVETKDQDADHTAEMDAWMDANIPEMAGLTGYVLKHSSPSCGMQRVKLYDHNNIPKKEASGLFAARLMATYPNLPVEEEGRLNDPILRENFIQRVFVYHRWQQTLADGLSVASLMEFHKRHKLMLLAHDEVVYRKLGPMIASVNKDNLDDIADIYIARMMHSLTQRSTRKRHTNVLMHIFGFLKNKLGSEVKAEILDILDRYRQGFVPLVVPMTMIRHYLKQYPHSYMDSQYYLEPYPDDLMLRNEV